MAVLLQPTPDLATLTEDEVRRSVHLRLVEADAFPREWGPRARRIGDSLVVVPCLDLPTTVVTPHAEHWEVHGGLERWADTAMANLRTLLAGDDLEHQVLDTGDQGGGFDLVLGASFLTASLALLGEELAHRFSPQADTARGLLVIVPFRHLVARRVVDGPDAATALVQLFRFAMLRFEDSPGPLSPHVYWVRGGEWRQITSVGAGGPTVTTDAELEVALGLSDGA